jgi:hypothetical protein
VLKDQLAPLYKIIENYNNLEYDPTPQQENAYNQAVEQIIQLEKQRNVLSGLPGLSGATSQSGASAMPSDIAALIKQYGKT